ncbi:MAG: FluC/FEX family fluoride channel [Ilumatobacteraceae bacterium]
MPSEPTRWRVPVAVAAGGVIGAGMRWLAGVPFDVTPGTFPVRTLVVNLVGCLLIGIAAQRLRRESVAWAFTVTGILGGFTTMSAFAQELNDLADADRTGLLIAYLVATVGGGMLALLIGERGAEARSS